MVLELNRRYHGPRRQIEESMAVAIDGEIFQDAYLVPLKPESEIYLIPKIGGNRARREEPRSSQPDSDELFEMASLFPRTTGLPMTVWSARAGPDPQNRRRLSPPHPREQGGEASSVRASPLLSKH